MRFIKILLLTLAIPFSANASLGFLNNINSFFLHVLLPNMTNSELKYTKIYKESTTISVSQARQAYKFLSFSELVYSSKTYPGFYIDKVYKDIRTGFDAKVYSNGEEAILAFRGSEFGLQDWITDGIHSSGLIAKQYRQAIDITQQFKKEYPYHDKYITGHSLGGGLGASAALANNLPAIVFDGTGINLALLSEIKSKFYFNNEHLFIQATKKITNYNLAGEFVSDSDLQQDADVAGEKTYQIGNVYYITNKRFQPILPLKTAISLHFTTPLKEELSLLSTAQCRKNKTDLTNLNNSINEKSLNKLFFPCWKDKTLDDSDIFNWKKNYLKDSLLN